jgi:tRNA(Arg) A34 adenosine deaminase TadA
MIDTIISSLPRWLQDEMDKSGQVFESMESRMRYVIELSRRNVAEGTGGPFGAAIFERESGRVVAVGVNLVLHSNCSHAHAEMTAIALAEQKLGSYTLADVPEAPYELVSSCEPCIMCLGGILWSGVSRVVSGASDEDARSIGFDEGPKPPDWAAALRQRGIEVEAGVCREEAAEVIRLYAASGGMIYNGTGG